MKERESFGSRLGFILVSAGCAIGIGNVWKFPYLAGENGGGLFVLFYFIFLLIMGVPVMSMELAIGRRSRKSGAEGFREIERKGSKWHIVGYTSIIGCYLLMMFYTSVAGWMISYFWKFLSGFFSSSMDKSAVSSVFSNMLSSSSDSLVFMTLSVVIGMGVCALGLKNGVEKITKVMMMGLLALIIILAIHSLTLPGAMEGLKFYLVPSIGTLKEKGVLSVVVAAMNQAFFTLSLGICAMEIFGTYMSKENTLFSEAFRISLLDTFVAVVSGLIIFPSCFSFSVSPDAGPSLIFVTLPNVFINMKGGRVWGTLFFVFMSFAALSTVIAVFENIIASFMDNYKWSRKKSVVINFISILLLSLPCALENNLLKGVTILGNKGVLDSWDFLVSNLLLPLGSIAIILFCVWRNGWGWNEYLKEANTGKGIKMPGSKAVKMYLGVVLPILVFTVMILGLL
ncbi:MAG: sodium-dependent transporter [Spirochaetales bacterium]|nr:sodium-dependent transporter [Spirochaetales bacterium]